MSKIQRAILNTLTYSDHFNFPLTLEELHSRLVGVHASHPQLTHSLNSLLAKGLIEQTSTYLHLPNRSQLVEVRDTRHKSSQQSLAALTRLLSYLTRVPGILGIYLTGALAVNNSHPNDDYDLMIVTQNNRLWLTRLVLTIYTQLLGLRRLPRSRQFAGKLCLNLYLTPGSFSLPPSRRSLYTAYELIQIRPMHDPHGLYPHLLAANPWVKDFLPNFRFPPCTIKLSSPAVSSLISYLDKLAYLIQYHYMKSKITRELITPHAAFFHPLNPGRSVLRRLEL